MKLALGTSDNQGKVERICFILDPNISTETWIYTKYPNRTINKSLSCVCVCIVTYYIVFTVTYHVTIINISYYNIMYTVMYYDILLYAILYL